MDMHPVVRCVLVGRGAEASVTNMWWPLILGKFSCNDSMDIPRRPSSMAARTAISKHFACASIAFHFTRHVFMSA
eukprot:9876755-Karenia_brevis.AAC.1